MKHILIVNPISSINYLTESFKQDGISTHAIFTNNLLKYVPKSVLNSVYSNKNIFDKHIYLENSNLEEVIPLLKDTNYDFIINGFEHSTEFTDQLSQKICPNFKNNPQTSLLRMSKYHTQEACEQLNNLKKINQVILEYKYFNDHEYINKLIDTKIKYPIFCKPSNGNSSEDVFKVNNSTELFHHLARVKKNRDYIIQEFIQGDEYFVDTTSIAGKHYLSFIGGYKKELVNGSPVYRSGQMLYDEKIWNKLRDSAKELLDAIDMQNGFAHIEFMVTKNNDIYLIEVNNRISGGGGVHCKITNYSGLLSQEKILSRFLHGHHIKDNELSDLKDYVIYIDLFKFKSGNLNDISNQLSEIQSIKEFKLFFDINTHITVPEHISLQDSVGYIILLNKDKSQLERDEQLVRNLEQML